MGLRFGVVCLAAVWFTARAMAQDLEVVLEANRRAMGGAAAANAALSFVASGNYRGEFDPAPISFSWSQTLDSLRVEVIVVRVPFPWTVINPRHAWERNPETRRFERLEPGNGERHLRAFAGPFLLITTKPAELVLEGESRVADDGRRRIIVRGNAPNGDVLRVRLDPETFLVSEVEEQRTVGETPVTFLRVYEGYTSWDGVLFPRTIRERSFAGGRTLTVDRFLPGPLPATLFADPGVAQVEGAADR